jgi:deazaflavin-dependent oxidoreductase (nitroreductase family)
VGIVQEFGYQVRKPNVGQMAMQLAASTRPVAWFFSKALDPIDRAVLRLSRGQVTLAGVAAGIPVLTVTTTGARSGQPRSSPLLGVPAGNDIAVIGTSFGRARTPGWYYNMRAHPAVEVTYRDKTISAVAREAGDEEKRVIWDRARKIYPGYQAYQRRITNREIHIMVLAAGEPPAPA